jgi:MFS family permease
MSAKTEGIAPNASRLLWAGFMAILAAGVGFAIRGGILSDWGRQFGFTGAELGTITGGGLTGFGLVILIGGLLADKLGYGKLVMVAFLCHALSAVVTFAATGAYGSGGEAGKHAAYQCLFWGTFLFAIGNGVLEAVLNPLVASLYPNNRTHYLNILHAGWPAGLILGGVAASTLGNTATHQGLKWEYQLALFLVPVVLYGVMCMGQHFPKSEASAKGLGLGDMMKDVGMLGAAVIAALLILFFKNDLGLSKIVAITLGVLVILGVGFFTQFSLGAGILALLLATHGLVGIVELGTDSWIQYITGAIIDPGTGRWLFVYTSAFMFVMRFFAGPIVHKISPVGLLLLSASCGVIGLYLISNSSTTAAVMGALAVYGLSKTFYWPTMLAVVGDRFPRSGAVAISCMGGMGMLAAGLLGGPGIGYFKDRYAAEDLQTVNPAAYAEFRAPTRSSFLRFEEVHAIDGGKLGAIQAKPEAQRSPTEKAAVAADLSGSRHTLRTVAFVPMTMAAIYLCLLLYFKAIGGYKPVHIGEDKRGGAPAPAAA